MKINKKLAVISLYSLTFTCVSSFFSKAEAGKFLGYTNFTPSTVAIPSGGFTAPVSFTFIAQILNNTPLTYHTTLSFQISEIDPIFNDVFDQSFSFVEQPSGNLPSSITVTTFLSSTELNQANDYLEGGSLEFVPGGFTVLQIPKPVPEPTSTLSFLALGTLGAGATLKRKLKSSKSSEKDNTKIS